MREYLATIRHFAVAINSEVSADNVVLSQLIADQLKEIDEAMEYEVHAAEETIRQADAFEVIGLDDTEAAS